MVLISKCTLLSSCSVNASSFLFRQTQDIALSLLTVLCSRNSSGSCPTIWENLLKLFTIRCQSVFIPWSFLILFEQIEEFSDRCSHCGYVFVQPGYILWLGDSLSRTAGFTCIHDDSLRFSFTVCSSSSLLTSSPNSKWAMLSLKSLEGEYLSVLLWFLTRICISELLSIWSLIILWSDIQDSSDSLQFLSSV